MNWNNMKFTFFDEFEFIKNSKIILDFPLIWWNI